MHFFSEKDLVDTDGLKTNGLCKANGKAGIVYKLDRLFDQSVIHSNESTLIWTI